jgi:hypothetical protein
MPISNTATLPVFKFSKSFFSLSKQVSVQHHQTCSNRFLLNHFQHSIYILKIFKTIKLYVGTRCITPPRIVLEFIHNKNNLTQGYSLQVTKLTFPSIQNISPNNQINISLGVTATEVEVATAISPDCLTIVLLINKREEKFTQIISKIKLYSG